MRIGKILNMKECLVLRWKVRAVNRKNDGKKIELDLAIDNSPMVTYKNKVFALSWNDILDLAEQAGLFKE